MGMNMTMDMKMQMTFFNDHKFTLFFDDWKIDSDGEYAAAILGLILVSLGFQILSYVIRMFSSRFKRQMTRRGQGMYLAVVVALQYAWCTTGYLLMLAVMTYSTGVLFAVVSGLTLGQILVLVGEKNLTKGGQAVEDEPLGTRPCH